MREAWNNHDWIGELFRAPQKSLQIEFSFPVHLRVHWKVALRNVSLPVKNLWRCYGEHNWSRSRVDTLIGNRRLISFCQWKFEGIFPWKFPREPHQDEDTIRTQWNLHTIHFYLRNHLFCFLWHTELRFFPRFSLPHPHREIFPLSSIILSLLSQFFFFFPINALKNSLGADKTDYWMSNLFNLIRIELVREKKKMKKEKTEMKKNFWH